MDDEYIEQLKREAEMGDSNAQFHLSLIYSLGTDLPCDKEKSLELMTLAAERNHTCAMKTLARKYQYESPELAMHWLTKAADIGNVEAQSILATIYANTSSIHFIYVEVPKDEKKAFMWADRAARNGGSSEWYFMGCMYANGIGVAQDDREAFNWIKMAADQGHEGAMKDLIPMYKFGYGVQQDCREAARLLMHFAEQGDAKSQYQLGVMNYKGDGIPRDYREAAKWFIKVAGQGNTKAQYQLGVMYASGDGVPRDFKAAVKWYRKAARQGRPVRAWTNLGNHYYNGDGVPQDYKEALKWYRKAAKCGFVPALHQLGLMYANGEGVPKDNVTACAWLIATGSHLLKADRYLVAARLTPEELAKAQELSRTLVKVPRRK